MQFSIITPCLNSVGNIQKTIDSVLGQDVEHLEYLIMDGGSCDGTLEIVREYECLYPDKVRIFSEPDGSMTEALNKGIRAAKGRIIGSINAGDWYNPSALKTVSEVFKNQGCDLVAGNTNIIAPSGAVAFQTIPWLVRFRVCWFILGCYPPESSVFYTRNLANEVGGFREQFKLTQDFDFYMRATAITKPVWVNALLSNFETSPSQISSTLSGDMAHETEDFMNMGPIYSFLQKTRLASAFRVLLGVRRYPSFKSFWEQLRHGRLSAP